jgi:predicted O-methyltransferase YrrM
MFDSLQEVILSYSDTPEWHTTMWNTCRTHVNADAELKSLRDFVERCGFGYGEREFYWMWNLLCKELPNNFKFLEIGVFQGQTTGLMSLLNARYKKNGFIFGLTPLDNTDKHPTLNYEERIQLLYAQINLDASDLTLIQGLSTTPSVIEQTKENGPFDVLYIDGGHDYDVVVNDIVQYIPMVKDNGYIVVDDASNDLQIPDGMIRMNWRGIPEVTKAVQDYIYPQTSLKHLFACGHNRIWQKLPTTS